MHHSLGRRCDEISPVICRNFLIETIPQNRAKNKQLVFVTLNASLWVRALTHGFSNAGVVDVELPVIVQHRGGRRQSCGNQASTAMMSGKDLTFYSSSCASRI
jgi:hypothetical protein